MSLKLNLPQNPPDVAYHAPSPVAQFVSDEADANTFLVGGPRIQPLAGAYPGYLRCPVDPRLSKRNLYLYMWSAYTAGNPNNFMVKGHFTFLMGGYGGTILGTLPVAVGSLSASSVVTNLSAATVCVSGGSPVENSIGLILVNPYSGMSPNPILQPFAVNAVCDTITLDIDSLFNVPIASGPAGFRAWMGVLSTTP